MLYIRYVFFLIIFCRIIQPKEYIVSFDSDIHVRKDATLLIQETIEVHGEQQNILHGIVREFPTKYWYSSILKYVVGFNIHSVTYNGHITPYHIKTVSNGKEVYIGDKNRLLPSGNHVYKITYQTNRQLGFFHDFDELYWNVTGTGWQLPIYQARARIFLPMDITSDSIVAVGYTGPQGAQDKNYTYSVDKENNCLIFSTTRSLNAYEGLTVAVGFSKGIILEPSKYQKFIWFIQDNIILIFIALLLILFMCGLIIAKFYNRPGNVIPLFYPPNNMKPSVVGFMTNKQFENLFLSADIIYLAVRGFINIECTANDNYTLTLLDLHNKTVDAYETQLLNELFQKNNTVNITRKYHDDAIKKSLKVCRNHVMDQVKSYAGNYPYCWYAGWIIYAAVLVFAFLTQDVFLSKIFILGCFLWILKKFYFLYTPEGRKIQDEIDGFRLYLMVAEIDRMSIVGTPPTKTPELYEKYLPYAIALKVEKEWTLQFSSLFQNLEKQGHHYRPGWYYGRDFGLNSLYSFSKVIASASTPPGSSSDSGGSGRSGKGGGGGGGRGW